MYNNFVMEIFNENCGTGRAGDESGKTGDKNVLRDLLSGRVPPQTLSAILNTKR